MKRQKCNEPAMRKYKKYEKYKQDGRYTGDYNLHNQRLMSNEEEEMEES